MGDVRIRPPRLQCQLPSCQHVCAAPVCCVLCAPQITRHDDLILLRPTTVAAHDYKPLDVPVQVSSQEEWAQQRLESLGTGTVQPPSSWVTAGDHAPSPVAAPSEDGSDTSGGSSSSNGVVQTPVPPPSPAPVPTPTPAAGGMPAPPGARMQPQQCTVTCVQAQAVMSGDGWSMDDCYGMPSYAMMGYNTSKNNSTPLLDIECTLPSKPSSILSTGTATSAALSWPAPTPATVPTPTTAPAPAPTPTPPVPTPIQVSTTQPPAGAVGGALPTHFTIPSSPLPQQPPQQGQQPERSEAQLVAAAAAIVAGDVPQPAMAQLSPAYLTSNPAAEVDVEEGYMIGSGWSSGLDDGEASDQGGMVPAATWTQLVNVTPDDTAGWVPSISPRGASAALDMWAGPELLAEAVQVGVVRA